MPFVVFVSWQWCYIFIQQTYILLSKFRLIEVIIWLLSKASLAASLWKTASLCMSHRQTHGLFIHTHKHIWPPDSNEGSVPPQPKQLPMAIGTLGQGELSWSPPAWDVPRPLCLESEKVHLGKKCCLQVLVYTVFSSTAMTASIRNRTADMWSDPVWLGTPAVVRAWLPGHCSDQ